MHSYSKHLLVAVELARQKMIDLQFDLRKEGLSDFSREYHGTFEKEDRPEYKWKAQVIKPDIDIEANKLVELISNGMGLGGKDGQNGQGASSGAPQGPQGANPLLSGPIAGMLDAQAKQLIEFVKTSVREVKLYVTWREGSKEETFDVVEHVVFLPDAAQRAAQDLRPQGGGGATGVDPVTGLPLNPLTGQPTPNSNNQNPSTPQLPGGIPNKIGIFGK
jgi:general secretion pathway protein I